MIRLLIAALALNGAMVWAQGSPRDSGAAAGVEAQMVLTVADHVSHRPAPLKPEDITIMDATITGWVALEGSQGAMDLYLVIDDAANYNFGSKLQELRKFATSQPAEVAIGVAYIHEGILQIAEGPTTDHAKAARALRAPSGSQSASLYCAISDLMQRWPTKALRREIVLVSTGIDDSASEGAVCVTAETAIRDAERAGVVIYALYNPSANYASEKWSKVDSGVVDMAHVCYETGGEAYFMSHNPMDSIAPFLEDISEHLAHQYLVKFRIAHAPENGYRKVYVTSGSSDRELMMPDSVWIPPAEK